MFRHVKQRFIFIKPTSFLVILVLMLLAANASANETVRYRYKNAEGVPVISFNLPAHYAQKGYEILDRNSNVIKVVPPAPSAADIEKVEKEREILAAYEILKRRYSKIEDIERAKQRKLQNINTNISILKGNITNLENGVDNLIKQAAEQERAGRKVHQNVLNRLSDTRAELKISVDLLKYREQEHQQTSDKYDQDIRTFIEGETLYKRLNSASLDQ